MRFKPTKSRSLVLKKGKTTDKYLFSLGTIKIPSLTKAPLKSLGKVFNCSLKDAAFIQATNEDLETWLPTRPMKTWRPGSLQWINLAWIYQHGILPLILWTPLVYEVPISTVERFEMRISRFLCRWLGLPQSLSSIALYGDSNKLKLPFSSLSKEFMVSRSRELLQYRESSDPPVALAGIEIRTGQTWRAAEAVDIAVSRLQQRVLVGTVAQGRAGLGNSRTPNYDKAQGKERRLLILEEVQMVQLRQQGVWTRLEQAVERKVTWNELWKAEPQRIKFLIQAVYDVLPSPSNLFTWGKVETPGCLLCQKRGTLEHILSCCSKALGEGRYRWQHVQVPKAVVDSSCSHNKSASQEKPAAPLRNTSPGLLATANDWELRVDLAKQLKFPEAVAKTTLRPDIIVTSVVFKQVILLELTVPWEDRMEEAHERKRAKYSELVEECRSNGWPARFAGQSLCRAYKMLGIVGANEQRAIKLVTNAAEAASRWLWIKRGEAWHVG
ncbi:polycystin 1L2 [Sarotherodon galilaeus]